jgi:hypothetical protein
MIGDSQRVVAERLDFAGLLNPFTPRPRTSHAHTEPKPPWLQPIVADRICLSYLGIAWLIELGWLTDPGR